MHAPSARTARRWNAPRISRRPTSAPRARASRRSSSCASIPRPLPPRPRFPQFAKRRSSQSDELGVVLVGALELQEVVVAAAGAVRVLAAYRRPRGINGAAAFFLVEVDADAVEHLV